MRCLQCNKKVGVLASLRAEAFCSEEHRTLYFDQQVRELVDRVVTADTTPAAAPAAAASAGPARSLGAAVPPEAPPVITAELGRRDEQLREQNSLKPPPAASCFRGPVQTFEAAQVDFRRPQTPARRLEAELPVERLALPGPGEDLGPARAVLSGARLAGVIPIRSVPHPRAVCAAGIVLKLPAATRIAAAVLGVRRPAEQQAGRRLPPPLAAGRPRHAGRALRPGADRVLRRPPLALTSGLAVPVRLRAGAPAALRAEPDRLRARVSWPPSKLPACTTRRLPAHQPGAIAGRRGFARPAVEAAVGSGAPLPGPGAALRPASLVSRGPGPCHPLFSKPAPWLRPGIRIRCRLALGRLSSLRCPALHAEPVPSTAELRWQPQQEVCARLALRPWPFRVRVWESAAEPVRTAPPASSSLACWALARPGGSLCQVAATLRFRIAAPEARGVRSRKRSVIDTGEKGFRTPGGNEDFGRFT